jgi:hypothetical protein
MVDDSLGDIVEAEACPFPNHSVRRANFDQRVTFEW